MAIYLPVGTPLWRDAGSPVVRVPGSAGAVDPVFAGVTVRDGEALAGPVGTTSLGRGGVILARVQGPVAMNAVVGRSSTEGATTVADRLVADGTPAVGAVLKAIGHRGRGPGAGAGGGSGGGSGGGLLPTQVRGGRLSHLPHLGWRYGGWGGRLCRQSPQAPPQHHRGNHREHPLQLYLRNVGQHPQPDPKMQPG